jgi:hypothetical protein
MRFRSGIVRKHPGLIVPDIESGNESSKMSGTGANWLKRVVIATVILSAIGLFADTGRAMAAEHGANAESTVHALGLFAFAWLLSSLRAKRKDGRWRLGLELSPISRVRAASTVHGVNARRAEKNSGRAGALRQL